MRRTAAAVTLGDGAPLAGGPPPGDPAALGALLDLLRERDGVTLERHDLVRAERPPRGGPFDLVACRNTLIYFDVPLQRRALTLLCGALAPGGLLWLGEAEWPPMPLAARLHPIDRRARLFRIAPEGGGHDA